ncbi:superoxide dismutase [Candidatus Gottesmanbacteria bacterium RBG_16_37_8]|uniref:Superoxide dismutase n=1 Tax=Candidatus Gottesmanbacteria bacterium RBG_16_37_8 TaxID=1798371 RepID=A0A1F5YTH9_9BACT|nr:MAG: superoxide dismutase [Candidatus Gottesmanbacteria bacterium RBG_16_37_8]
MKYTLPQLPFAYNALEPFIDARTMEIHYTKHHQAYINNLNALLEKYSKLADRKLEEIMSSLDSLGLAEKDKNVLRNHGGGHLNHSFFWTIMSPKKHTDERLVSEIKKEFSSIDEFKALFKQTAITRFGSGWVWLVRAKNKLQVYSTPNQDSPLLQGHHPIIGLDVWEHAYYLKYQNKRDEYIDNWWNVLKFF